VRNGLVEQNDALGAARGKVEFHQLYGAFDRRAQPRRGGVDHPKAALAIGDDAVDVDERPSRVAAFAPLVPPASREVPRAAIGKHLDDPRRRGAEPGRQAGEKTTVPSADRAVPETVGRLSNFYQFSRHDIPSFGCARGNDHPRQPKSSSSGNIQVKSQCERYGSIASWLRLAASQSCSMIMTFWPRPAAWSASIDSSSGSGTNANVALTGVSLLLGYN
jgi:hypothetical protein